jgi:putative ABC transport system permease protein
VIAVLRLLHWPFWKRAPLEVMLPALGVALGVAAIVAVDLAGASAVESFRDTVRRLDGRTTDRVVGDPVPDDLARRLARVPGVEAAAPVVERMALYTEGEGAALRLLGIDPLAEGDVRTLGAVQSGDGRRLRDLMGRPGALAVSGAFLDRHGLRVDDSLPLAVGAYRRPAFVTARLPAEVGGVPVPADLAVGDIATVQELAGSFGGVDRVDLVIPDSARAAALPRVSALLLPGTRLERPGSEAERLERTLSAFRANIRALSYLALFVSFFLIYNGQLLAVLRRRPLIGTARCLGATRAQVLGGWLGEALVTGLVGVGLGLGLGILFARPALRQVARTASDLYGATGSDTLAILPATLVKAALVGLAFTLLSALMPALEAAATPPAHTSARSGVEIATRRRRRRAPWLALPLLGACVLALAWPAAGAAAGYVAAICLALAAALLVPLAVDRILAAFLFRRGGRGWSLLSLAAANIRANTSRTGVALAALTIALSMAVAMGTLVGSFRQELERWIEGSVRGDVYVSPLGLEADRRGATLPPDLPDRLRALPGVAEVATYRERSVRVRGRDTFLAAIDARVARSRSDWSLLSGGSAAAFFDGLERGEAGVSEALHRKTGIEAGDRIAVALGAAVESLTVAGVYRDYSTESGIVLVDRAALLARGLDLGPPRSVALYVKPGVDAGAMASAVRGAAGNELGLLVRTNEELKSRALAIFERTFAITRVLQMVGLVVAAIGILGALLAMLLERTRELATLRALGLTRAQLARLFLGESTLLAAFAWAFALVTGGLLAWILLSVINVRSFGWALEYRVPWSTWGIALAASLAASWAATLWPLRRLARMDAAPLLREE